MNRERRLGAEKAEREYLRSMGMAVSEPNALKNPSDPRLRLDWEELRGRLSALSGATEASARSAMKRRVDYATRRIAQDPNLSAAAVVAARRAGNVAGGVRGMVHADLVAGWLRRARPSERDLRLRQLLAHAAAGLVLASGPEAAAETVYRLADAIVEKG